MDSRLDGSRRSLINSRLRTAMVSAAAISTVLLSGLWAMSHHRRVYFATPAIGSHSAGVGCQLGRVTLLIVPRSFATAGWQVGMQEYLPNAQELRRTFPCFAFSVGGGWMEFTAPCWLLVLTSALAATAAATRRFRFTVRTLLTALTLAALLLGAIVAERS
ncbi:MAG TPA: hypothetical protein VF175_10505 [Lacipirellula sp.]